VPVSIGDPRRAAEELGFRARGNLPDGLASTLEALTRGKRAASHALA